MATSCFIRKNSDEADSLLFLRTQKTIPMTMLLFFSVEESHFISLK